MSPYEVKLMKRITALLLVLAVIFSLCACADNEINKDRLSVVTVLFSEYDFASHISGGLADVKMLLPPGSESHSYDPAPQDIIAIKNGDDMNVIVHADYKIQKNDTLVLLGSYESLEQVKKEEIFYRR